MTDAVIASLAVAAFIISLLALLGVAVLIVAYAQNVRQIDALSRIAGAPQWTYENDDPEDPSKWQRAPTHVRDTPAASTASQATAGLQEVT